MRGPGERTQTKENAVKYLGLIDPFWDKSNKSLLINGKQASWPPSILSQTGDRQTQQAL